LRPGERIEGLDRNRHPVGRLRWGRYQLQGHHDTGYMLTGYAEFTHDRAASAGIIQRQADGLCAGQARIIQLNFQNAGSRWRTAPTLHRHRRVPVIAASKGAAVFCENATALRQRATYARQLADGCLDDQMRETLRELADRWEQMASSVERCRAEPEMPPAGTC
jgi:hypothetical protein